MHLIFQREKLVRLCSVMIEGMKYGCNSFSFSDLISLFYNAIHQYCCGLNVQCTECVGGGGHGVGSGKNVLQSTSWKINAA